MAQVGFYHLTRTSPEAALPPLLGRTLAGGERAVVVCGSEARVAAVDEALWAVSTPEWLPHGTARTGHAALQLIWLSLVPENPNGARFLFLLDGMSAELAGWTRVFDLFDGTDDAAVQAARARWSAARAGGHTLTYWKQTATGWEKG